MHLVRRSRRRRLRESRGQSNTIRREGKTPTLKHSQSGTNARSQARPRWYPRFLREYGRWRARRRRRALRTTKATLALRVLPAACILRILYESIGIASVVEGELLPFGDVAERVPRDITSFPRGHHDVAVWRVFRVIHEGPLSPWLLSFPGRVIQYDLCHRFGGSRKTTRRFKASPRWLQTSLPAICLPTTGDDVRPKPKARHSLALNNVACRKETTTYRLTISIGVHGNSSIVAHFL